MNYFLYYILLGVWCLFSLLPLRIHYIISDFLFWLLYKVIGYRRRVVWKNLSASFPEKSEAELKEIERGFYHFLCDYFVETVKMMTISKKEIKRRIIYKGIKDLDEVIESGQSIAVYVGHYCNWEWVTSMPLWVTPKVQCGQIYHPLENKYFDKLLLRSRERLSSLCISMQDTLREVVRYKREGQPIMIGYISDQAPNWVNIHHWVDFLNQDTPVFTGTERIVKKMNLLLNPS